MKRRAPEMHHRRRPGRIGPWRLLDLMHATMPWRAGLFMGAPALPEYGPPDSAVSTADPEELPLSNISEGEQQQAIQRERARRFVRLRRPEEAAGKPARN
jgi:hypothetical protein